MLLYSGASVCDHYDIPSIDGDRTQA